MNGITIVGFLAALCTTLSFLPQVIKIIKIKETKDISFLMYAILIAGVLLWIIYGILKQDVPIIVANVITFVLATTVLILKIKHG
ncbi:MAG: SemiSWEET transporter [Thermodesulfobacteriota bacterium]